ncbi:MAG: 4-(cytidine 5'-diphospho)-2-C-methyl-D-erythritol kinase [Pseudomonadales bacterium]|jgi:4-diphosphocytidyl-2-C-methyl-D-erythritol kinase|nr:4-(cytidine 5'-diphospho)-2-C-methyl-D-erythritol kinase [Pseudomonadales bacterium]
MTTVLKSPAKINLGIAIKSILPNGWHEIDNVFHAIPAYDILEVELMENKIIEITCNDPEVPTDQNNFLHKVFIIMADKAKYGGGIKINLIKKLPIGSGLGGGSLNASTLIKFLNEHWQLNLSKEQLIEIAKNISSDVVFNIFSDCAFETKHGLKENGELEILPSLKNCAMVIVWPETFISIQDAYKIIDENFEPSTYQIENLVEALREQNFANICKHIHNDFEKKISEHYPVVRELKTKFENLQADGISMSGKGPAIYGLYQDKNLAKKAFVELSKKHKHIWNVEF